MPILLSNEWISVHFLCNPDGGLKDAKGLKQTTTFRALHFHRSSGYLPRQDGTSAQNKHLFPTCLPEQQVSS